MAGSRSKKTDGAEPDAGAGEYAREAAAQWAKAARLGAAAITPKLKNAGGAAVGTLANKALAKTGWAGKLASKAGVGSKLVHPKADSDAALDDDAPDSDEAEDGIPVPVQESIDVAVPVAAAYRLLTRVEEYPSYLDRVEHVERQDESRMEFVARIRGQRRRLPIEVFDARPNERLDWRSTGGLEHSGAITFHQLAPRLTHIELSVDFAPRGLVRRIARTAGIPDRVVRAEMNRFKAYAELYEDEEPGDEEEPEAEEQPADEAGSDDTGAEEDEEVPAEAR